MAKRSANPTARARERSIRTPAAMAPVVVRYIESSALVAALLEGDAGAATALRAKGRRVTSALTFAEAARAIVRARATGRVTPAEERAALRGLQVFERRCDIVAVTDAVLTRAGRPFPVEPIRTLDAVHLATAEFLGEPPQLVTIVTRDARVSGNARALRKRSASAGDSALSIRNLIDQTTRQGSCGLTDVAGTAESGSASAG